MFKTSHLRFEHKVALSVGLLCLALVGASIGGAIWIGKSDAIDRISEESTELAGNMTSALDSAMFERFREIQTIAGLEPIKDVWRSDTKQVRSVLDMLQTSLPTYAWIGFVGPDGTVLASTKGMLEGASVAARPWFKAGLHGPALTDVHEALLLSRLLDAVPQSEPARFVDVSMPVYDRKRALVGVLGAHLNWTWAAGIRQRLLDHSGVAGAGTAIWILSADGKIILGPHLGEAPFDAAVLATIRTEKRGVFEDRSAGGESVLTGFATTGGFKDYPGLGWIVVTRSPTSVAFASVDHTVRMLLLFSSVTALIGVVLAWYIARQMSAPIRRLTASAHQIGRDSTMTMLPWLGGSREFVELSAALRSLLRRVGIAERERTEAVEQSSDDTRQLRETIDILRQEADHDPLTGLLNRRAFLTFADDVIPYYRRYRRTVAIMMVDIDFFKVVNDTYGHAAGDRVLGYVADALSSAARATDKVSRFGGEEFVILAHEVDEDGALKLANELRLIVAAAGVPHSGKSITVTISIGVALIDDGDVDIQALIERADLALYAAKKSGRNCVRLQASHGIAHAA